MMKKRLLCVLAAFVFVLACAVPAFAASGFNLSVMRTGEDIMEIYDRTDKSYTYTVKSLYHNEDFIYYNDDGGEFCFLPMVISDDDYDCYAITIQYEGKQFMYANSATFEIAGKQYIFTDLDPTYERVGGRTPCRETFTIILDPDSQPMMEALINNRSKSVRVLVDGSNFIEDYTMDTDMKNYTIHLYNLFVQAGGLRDDNWQATYGNPCTIK